MNVMYEECLEEQGGFNVSPHTMICFHTETVSQENIKSAFLSPGIFVIGISGILSQNTFRAFLVQVVLHSHIPSDGLKS